MDSKQAKHTPGPWRHDPARNEEMLDDFGINGTPITSTCEHLAENNGGQEIVVATAIPTRDSVPEVYANARLIAASPELLEACKAFMRYHESDMSSVDCMLAYEQARSLIVAAIAKAEGGAE